MLWGIPFGLAVGYYGTTIKNLFFRWVMYIAVSIVMGTVFIVVMHIYAAKQPINPVLDATGPAPGTYAAAGFLLGIFWGAKWRGREIEKEEASTTPKA